MERERINNENNSRIIQQKNNFDRAYMVDNRSGNNQSYLSDSTLQRISDEEEETLQGKFDTPVQRVEDEDDTLQGKFDSTIQKKNETGMPDNLKAGIESLSGFSMDDVRVHYNSSKPATIQALAYTQGTDIHVAPGQEKHLPHEAWHVAQQMAGRVSPTTNINGIPVNDNDALEHEADVMGEKAVQNVQMNNNVFANNKKTTLNDACCFSKSAIQRARMEYRDGKGFIYMNFIDTFGGLVNPTTYFVNKEHSEKFVELLINIIKKTRTDWWLYNLSEENTFLFHEDSGGKLNTITVNLPNTKPVEVEVEVDPKDIYEDSKPENYRLDKYQDGGRKIPGNGCVIEALVSLNIRTEYTTPEMWDAYCRDRDKEINYQNDSGAYLLYKELGFELQTSNGVNVNDFLTACDAGKYVIIIGANTTNHVGHAIGALVTTDHKYNLYSYQDEKDGPLKGGLLEYYMKIVPKYIYKCNE